MGGRRYCKEEVLTRSVLFEYLKSKGEIKGVSLLDVYAHTMEGLQGTRGNHYCYRYYCECGEGGVNGDGF